MTLQTGADGVPTSLRIPWKAKCKRNRGRATFEDRTDFKPPFDQATVDLPADEGTYRLRDRGGSATRAITVSGARRSADAARRRRPSRTAPPAGSIVDRPPGPARIDRCTLRPTTSSVRPRSGRLPGPRHLPAARWASDDPPPAVVLHDASSVAAGAARADAPGTPAGPEPIQDFWTAEEDAIKRAGGGRWRTALASRRTARARSARPHRPRGRTAHRGRPRVHPADHPAGSLSALRRARRPIPTGPARTMRTGSQPVRRRRLTLVVRHGIARSGPRPRVADAAQHAGRDLRLRTTKAIERLEGKRPAAAPARHARPHAVGHPATARAHALNPGRSRRYVRGT